jgi:hypothetical protein
VVVVVVMMMMATWAVITEDMYPVASHYPSHIEVIVWN